MSDTLELPCGCRIDIFDKMIAVACGMLKAAHPEKPDSEIAKLGLQEVVQAIHPRSFVDCIKAKKSTVH